MNLALKKDKNHMSILNGKLIEPLTGVGRHPFAKVGCNLPVKMTSILNISYIETSNYCNLKIKSSKFFDMGCTTYKGGSKPSAGGPSIPFFINLYSKSCVIFDEIWAWEVKTIQNWWEHVPKNLKPDIHFYNTPVTAEEFEFAV
jgi:hypothetical protein